jgi:hypothetical protein
MGLPFLQHEAVVGPPQGSFLIEIARLFDVAFRLGKNGLASQHTVDVSGGGHPDAAGEDLGLVLFPGGDENSECGGQVAAAPWSAVARDLVQFLDEFDCHPKCAFHLRDERPLSKQGPTSGLLQPCA